MPAVKRINVQRFNVALARPLHRRLKIEAKRARRTLAEEVEARLAATMDRSWSLVPQPIPAEPESATAA
jgi:hypothetical protein